MEKTNLNFRHRPNEFQTQGKSSPSFRKGLGVGLFILFGLFGVNQTAWAHTFNKDEVIYVDMTAITASNFTAKIFVDFGDKYTATKLSGSYTFQGYNNGEFTSCNAPKIQLTFKETVNIGSDKTIFESSVGNWTSIKNQFPTSGQNLMTVGSDGKSITWSTYGGGGGDDKCKNCGTVNNK